MRPRDGEAGMTLVELLVAILILGIVGAMVLTSVVQATRTSADATTRTNALTDLERGIERIGREVRVADPLVIDPDGVCNTLAAGDGARCQDEVLSRRLDAVVFRDSTEITYEYYLVPSGTDAQLYEDRTVRDLGGTVLSTATGQFITDIAPADLLAGEEPIFQFVARDSSGELVAIDCDPLTVAECLDAHATATAVRITLRKIVPDGDPLVVSTTVQIRNTRYDA